MPLCKSLKHVYLSAIKYEFNDKLLNFIKNDSKDNILPIYNLYITNNILWIDIFILILKYYIIGTVSKLFRYIYGIYVELIFGENIAFKILLSVEYILKVSSIYLHTICLKFKLNIIYILNKIIQIIIQI